MHNNGIKGDGKKPPRLMPSVRRQQMQKSILAVVFASFLTLTLSGCAGLMIAYPDECKNETPFTGVHDIFWKKPRPKQKVLGIVIPEIPHPKISTKAEFLKEWGKPVKIIATSENEETWIYERHLWCGAVPIIFLLPVPLLLPVCDGFDRIEFQGNEAKRLHTRRILWAGIILLPPTPLAGDPVCRYPLPSYQGVDAVEASPTTQVMP
jgi:hypothetical protein